MIAVVISAILLLGATGLFISNKRIYKEQDAMGRLQENARFAMDMLIKDIRRAAYVGCSDKLSQVTNNLSPITSTDLLNFSNPVEGSEAAGNWKPSDSTQITGSILPLGSMQARPDGITVRYLSPINTGLVKFTTAQEVDGTTAVPVTCPSADCTANPTVVANDYIGLSNCSNTDLFKVTAVNATSLAHTAGLSTTFADDSQISFYVANRYYISNSATDSSGNQLVKNDSAGNPVPSLMRYTYTPADGITNQLLIEGVENMQILYGVDNNADTVADSYVNASGVAAAGGWDNVVSVRIGLLMRTVDPDFSQDPDTRAYSLLGTSIYTAASPPNDNFRRRVFSTTVQIRNRTQ